MTLRETRARAHAVTRLIALPFRMLRADPQTEFLGFALPDAVASRLSCLDALVVRSTGSALGFDEDEEGEIDFARVAKEADVDVIMAGSILGIDRLRVCVQMLEGRESAVLWSQELEVTTSHLFQLQDEIVHRIVESLALSLTARERRWLSGDLPATPAAYELFLRGNHRMESGSMDRESLAEARELYRQCVQEDPRYAPAWVRMGRCHFLLAKGGEDHDANLVEAESCLERALALCPDLPEAHHAYAMMHIDQGLAREAMARLVRLASDAADSRFFKTLEQACRACGLLEASVAAYEEARRIDPGILTSENACIGAGLSEARLGAFGEHARSLAGFDHVLNRGFNPYRQLIREDPWLEGLRETPGYDSLLDRARADYDESVAAFRAAGGETLLAIRVPDSAELETDPEA